MPSFRITAPDGTVYNVTGPDGATEQDALAQVQAQHQGGAISDATEQQLQRDMPLTGVGGAVKPSLMQSLQASAPGELLHGVLQGGGGIAQFATNRAADLTGNSTLRNVADRINAGIGQDQRSQDLARKLSGTDVIPGWANPGDTAGRVAATAPIGGIFGGPAANAAVRALQGVGMGATYGATTPVTDTRSEDYSSQSNRNALVGALLGGGTSLLMSGAGRLSQPPVSPEEKARQLVLSKLAKDNIAPENAVQAVGRYPDKQTSLMDVAGSNTQRLGRTVATIPGESSEQVSKFLSERQADQHARVIDDINATLTGGGDPYQIAQKLIEQRSTAAGPLYDQAYAANKNIDSPTVDRILETPAGRKALADARQMMMNDRKLMGVPDAELRLQALEGGTPLPKGGVASGLKLETLDYVKKALDDQTSAAIRAGETRKAGILSGLTKDFRSALDEADATAKAGPNSVKAAGGLYAQARAAFSGPSQSLDALEQGKEFLKINSPNELKDVLANLDPGDRDFFKIGAASALRDRVNAAGDNYDAVSRVFGNQRLRDQITSVFGKDSVNRFAESMGAEKMATGTKNFVLGGSNTANKLADVAGNSVGQDALEGYAQGGWKGAVRKPLLNLARAKASAYFNGMTPEVRNSLADLLTRNASGVTAAPPAVVPSSKLQGLPTNAITAAILARLLAQPSSPQTSGSN